MDIVLVANSPGELSVLAKPVARAFKDKNQRVILFLTPCQYASGQEVEFARKNLAVDEVLSAEDYKKWILGGKVPVEFDQKGICLYLGGDLLHASLIAKKLNYPAYAYLSGTFVNWAGAFNKFFVPDRARFDYFAAKGVPADKLLVTGDLMVDGTESISRSDARTRWHLDARSLIVAFMPGSRKWEISHMLPIYEEVVNIMKKDDPELRTVLIASPFVSVDYFLKYKQHHVFDAFTPFDSIAAADLVVTVPGTNTAQVAALGLPMLVVFPLDRPEVIPLEGLLHYISSIPGLSRIIKRIIAWQVNRKTKFFALPNIKANREIVREIRGKIDPGTVARRALELVNDYAGLCRMSRELKDAMGEPGAAEKIAREILNGSL